MLLSDVAQKNIFRDFIGQARVKEMLCDLEYTGNVGHAYVFNGPSGIGRRKTAKNFAALLLCTGEHEKGMVCGQCESCLLMQNDTNPDYICVGLPKDKKTVSVDSIREMKEDMLTAPLIGRKKVFVIEYGDKMTAEAQNALLKTLEEPPPYAVIIIVSSNPLMLLDTVRSRTIRIDFSRYTHDEIRQAYKAMRAENADENEEELICAYADGIIGRVYELGDWQEIRTLRTDILNAMCGLCRGGFEERKKLSALMNKKGEESELVMFTLLSFFRDIVHIVRFGKNANLQNKEYREKLYETGRDIGYYKALECINIIDSTWKDIGRNAAYTLAVENMIIKLQEVMAV